jgi:hypothetical protein
MVRRLRHRHALRQVEIAGVDVEMPCRPAVAAVHLQQLPSLMRLPTVTGLKWKLAAAPRLLSVLLQLESSGSQ